MSDVPRTYPDKLEVKPLERPPVATVRVPGSKSITNRALVLAALARGVHGCALHGVLKSEDTEIMVEALRKLGIPVRAEWERALIQVPPRARGEALVPAKTAELYLANSGTSMRFLTAFASLGTGRYRLDGNPRMRERPIGDLLDALRQCGVEAVSEFDNDCPPVHVTGRGPDSWGLSCTVRAGTSSQFLSALLMTAPFGYEGHVVEVEGSVVSEPYVDMTLRMMRGFGIPVQRDGSRFRFSYYPPYPPSPARFEVEPDASAASYFWAAAAIASGATSLAGLAADSLQGDVHFVDVLEEMGCAIECTNGSMAVRGRPLHGIDVDMNAISDTVMTLAAVACFADGPTTIRNVAHIRHKETDRLAALATELRRLGAEVDEFADGLTITPRPLQGDEVETYNDHRMAMSLALIGLRVPGVVIKNPGCVAKTYPGFWDDLERLRT